MKGGQAYIYIFVNLNQRECATLIPHYYYDTSQEKRRHS